MVEKALQPLHLIQIVSSKNYSKSMKRHLIKIISFDFVFSFFSVNPIDFFEHQFSSDDEDDEMAELEMQGDQAFVIDKQHIDKRDPYPTTAKKMEIVRKLDAMTTPKTLQKLQHHYANISSLSTVYDWKKIILENGNRNLAIRFFNSRYRICQKLLFSGGLYKDKLIEIDSNVLQRFKQSRADRIRVHDRQLIRWGMEKSRELNIDFRASHHWLLNFKKRHNIVSRKITRQVTRKNIVDAPQTLETVNRFVGKIWEIFERDPAKIFNTDQTGFNIELYSSRTHEEKGTRHVEALVEAKNSLTHSYTVMPLISGDGKLIKPTLIVHREPKDGEFGPRVLSSMFTHNSIIVASSMSGKVTKPILEMWADRVFFSAQGTNGGTLLLDSLPMQKDIANLNRKKPRNFQYSIEFIPPGTTKELQPLDKEPNRTLKEMVRHLSEGYNIVDARITNRKRISTRDAIDMIQVLVLNQFDSPRFSSWISHSWKSCGYTTRIYDYISPTKYCFDYEVSRHKCVLCEKSSFIKCGWCANLFCEYHYFFQGEIHFCSTHVA